MALQVASLYATLGLDKSDFDRKIRDVDGRIGGLSQGLASGLGAIGKIGLVGAAAAVAGIGALGAGLKTAIDLADEQQRVETQLAAVLKSTGHAAGLTAGELKYMASSFQSLTTYGDEAVLSAENLLLTFTNIKGPVFKQAVSAILDVRTAMGQDLKSSTIQLGKALNDPLEGLSALTRVGIQFSESQKELITQMMETGDVAGAQGVILEELNRQFGGSAAAQADTFAGRLQQVKNAIGDAGEQIGIIFMPMLKDLAEKVLPEIGRIANEVVVPAIGNIRDVIMGFATGDITQGAAGLLGLGFTPEQVQEILNAYQSITDSITGIRDALGGINTSIDISVTQAIVDTINALAWSLEKVNEALTIGVGLYDQIKTILGAGQTFGAGGNMFNAASMGGRGPTGIPGAPTAISPAAPVNNYIPATIEMDGQTVGRITGTYQGRTIANILAMGGIPNR